MHAIAVMAAVLLTVAPSLDSVAHAATVAVKAGDCSVTTRILSAFDMIDDLLDHMPGDHPTCHQHVFQPGWPPDRIAFSAPSIKASVRWRVPETLQLDFVVLKRITRPPRA